MSPLTTVNRANVAQLEQAWTWRTNERAIPAGAGQKPARPGQFQASPIVIGDTMYVSTPYGQRTLRAGRGYANPISYRAANGVRYVVIASGAGEDAELVAFRWLGVSAVARVATFAATCLPSTPTIRTFSPMLLAGDRHARSG